MPLTAKADALYEQSAKPLEETKRGKYVAIAPDGKFLLGDSAVDVMVKSRTALEPGNFVFKIGERAELRQANQEILRRVIAKNAANREKLQALEKRVERIENHLNLLPVK